MPDQDHAPADPEPHMITEMRAELRDLATHRTRMETRWSLITALVGALGVGGIVAAVTTRDSVQSTALRVAALERAQTDAVITTRERDSDDRAMREALTRLTVTVDALRARVEDLTSELRARETAAPTRPVGR